MKEAMEWVKRAAAPGILLALFQGAVFAAQYTSTAAWGSYGNNSGQLYGPSGITIDRSGSIYVADTNNHRILKFDQSGSLLTGWGEFGTTPGRFNFPRGVAVDYNGNIYVADTGNNRVQVLNMNGALQPPLGGKFNHPMAIAINRNSGIVYVADTMNYSVVAYGDSKQVIYQWQCFDDVFNERTLFPSVLAVDPDGNVYVANLDNNTVLVFNSSGMPKTKFISDSRPLSMAIDNTGNIFLASADCVKGVNTAGALIFQIGAYGREKGQLNMPCGIALDSAGRLYVADTGNNRVQVFAK